MSLATTAVLRVIMEHDGVYGVVLACFGEPGLVALREILPVPVVGIAEASFLTACTIGFKFGIMAWAPKDVPAMENLLWTYGLEKRYAGTWPMKRRPSASPESALHDRGDKHRAPLRTDSKADTPRHAPLDAGRHGAPSGGGSG
jgi:Asp/Glu/hydantoin racemase